MMNEPPKPMEGDEICPICKKLKRLHKPEEILACSKKISDLDKSREN